MISYLNGKGYSHIERDDATDYNFIMGNNDAQFVDFHVIELDENGNGTYGPLENGSLYPASAFTGTGIIGGKKVNCFSAEYQVESHSGYIPRDKDYQDVLAICGKFNIQLPIEYRRATLQS